MLKRAGTRGFGCYGHGNWHKNFSSALRRLQDVLDFNRAQQTLGNQLVGRDVGRK